MIKSIFSPYRICPLGAHVDHQGGPALGRTIGIGTTLEYEGSGSGEVLIVSELLGEVSFSIGDLDVAHWARYAQAAARVLKIRRGLQAHVRGSFVGSGLSSSASVGLAFLKAFADVNGLDVSKQNLVQLDFELEHGELGLQNGLLDPLTIVHGQKDALLFMDTLSPVVSPIPDPFPTKAAWIVAYSGISRELTKSGFNQRVEECRQAADFLLSGAHRLSDISPEIFDAKRKKMPDRLRRRAEHYYTEVERVWRGARAWQEADLERFGLLMNRSCSSSINNYESGSDILIELHELVSSTAGIHGSRFSGGGYGGCVVALAQASLATEACQAIAERFQSLHPELPSQVFVAETGGGLE